MHCHTRSSGEIVGYMKGEETGSTKRMASSTRGSQSAADETWDGGTRATAQLKPDAPPGEIDGVTDGVTNWTHGVTTCFASTDLTAGGQHAPQDDGQWPELKALRCVEQAPRLGQGAHQFRS